MASYNGTVSVDLDVEFDAQFVGKMAAMKGGDKTDWTEFDIEDVKAIVEQQVNDAGTVELSKNDQTGLAILIVDNPRKCNALSGNVLLQLNAAVDDLQSWDAGRGVLIMGKNNMFCSGADLKLIKSLHDSPDGVTICAFAQYVLSKLHNLRIITAALVQGAALGGGAELATACDFRLMAESSVFGFVQVSMGITTAFGGGTHLVQCLGRNRALDVLTSCRKYTAAEAESLGWACALVPDGEQGIYHAHAWLEQRCQGQPEVIHAAKDMVATAAVANDYRWALKNEMECLARTWGGPAQKAALNNAKKHTK